MKTELTARLAERLSSLRAAKGWTLDRLASESGVSRAALSRLENAEVSPSAEVLARLAKAHAMSLSRLLALVEDGFAAHIARADQEMTRDDSGDFVRRHVSPTEAALAAGVTECKVAPGSEIQLDSPAVDGQEQHLIMNSGYLHVDLDGKSYALGPGDSLRFRQHGPMRYVTAKGQGAKFLLVAVSS
ncbi:MAG: XRE family transcriptional regulator [Pelagimonas sp.]|jgi:transcriptional regulator with XRE-family HTH domain|nr:XRE family transcriptional regulator [Pelagimonas sp.]